MNLLANTFLLVYSIILPLFVLVVPKGMLAVKIFKNCYKVKSIDIISLIKCYTPIHNYYIMRKSLYKKAPLMKLLTNIVLGIGITTVLVRFLLPATEGNEGFLIIQLIFSLVMMLVIVFVYVTEVYINLELCSLLEFKQYRIWAIITPPLCSYLLANKVDPYFKKMGHVLDGTFDAKGV